MHKPTESTEAEKQPFPRFWRKLGHTAVRVNEYVAELRLFPERPWRNLVARLNTPCGRCAYPVRKGDKVCWLPAANGHKSIVFHWSCAPAWAGVLAGSDKEREIAMARSMMEVL
jgi:hypothetical protein